MKEFLLRCRREWLFIAIFSISSNILALALPLYTMQVYDRVLASRSLDTLMLLTMLTLGLVGAMVAIDTARARILAAIGRALEELASPIVISAVVHAAALPGQTGKKVSLRDVQTVQNYLSSPAASVFFDLPWVPLFLGLLFVLHWWLGIVATTGALLILLLAVMSEMYVRPLVESSHSAAAESAAFVDRMSRNAEIAIGQSMLDALLARWNVLGAQAREESAGASQRAALALAASRSLRLWLQVAMVAIGAHIVISEASSPGVILASTLILGRGLAPLELAVSGWRGFSLARVSYHRLQAVVADVDSHEKLIELPAPVGHVRFSNVLFAPVSPDRPTLKGISLEIPGGTSVGIIGPSAAGKTTLLRLLAGVWRPWSGHVRLDGSDIQEWAPTQRGRYIGYLPQDVELFPGTIAENIARFEHKPDSDVIEAAKRAGAHEMILQLPGGYAANVGENAGLLSGGQRQRIGLARALLGQPRLVLLDEPNSNLDTAGEDALKQTLSRLRQDKVTTVIVSHKPSMLLGCDRLLVLNGGVVELDGPTQEVLRRVLPIAERSNAGTAPDSGMRS